MERTENRNETRGHAMLADALRHLIDTDQTTVAQLAAFGECGETTVRQQVAERDAKCIRRPTCATWAGVFTTPPSPRNAGTASQAGHPNPDPPGLVFDSYEPIGATTCAPRSVFRDQPSHPGELAMATRHPRSDARIFRELTRWADDQRGHAPEAPEPPVRLGQGDHTTDWSGEPVNYRHGLLAAIGLAIAFAVGALLLAMMHAGTGGASAHGPRSLTAPHPDDPAMTARDGDASAGGRR